MYNTNNKKERANILRKQLKVAYIKYNKFNDMEHILTFMFHICAIVFVVVGFLTAGYKHNDLPDKPLIFLGILAMIMGTIYLVVYYYTRKNIIIYANKIRNIKRELRKVEKSIRIDSTNDRNFKEIENYFENNWFLGD